MLRRPGLTVSLFLSSGALVMNGLNKSWPGVERLFPTDWCRCLLIRSALFDFISLYDYGYCFLLSKMK